MLREKGARLFKGELNKSLFLPSPCNFGLTFNPRKKSWIPFLLHISTSFLQVHKLSVEDFQEAGSPHFLPHSGRTGLVFRTLNPSFWKNISTLRNTYFLTRVSKYKEIDALQFCKQAPTVFLPNKMPGRFLKKALHGRWPNALVLKEHTYPERKAKGRFRCLSSGNTPFLVGRELLPAPSRINSF